MTIEDKIREDRLKSSKHSTIFFSTVSIANYGLVVYNLTSDHGNWKQGVLNAIGATLCAGMALVNYRDYKKAKE